MTAAVAPRLVTLWRERMPTFRWEVATRRGHRHGFMLDVTTTTEGLTIAFVSQTTAAGWQLIERREWGGTTEIHRQAAQRWAEDRADEAAVRVPQDGAA